MITVLVTCFDISGDYNGYDLIRYALKNFPGRFRFLCIAGERIRKLEGPDVIMVKDHIVESSIGVIEGAKYIFSTLRFFRWFKRYIKGEKIDLLLCIDGQGRNIVLGEMAKRLGIKTAYFFPPHVSIIGKWNVKKMKWFDSVLTPFLADHRLYSAGGHRSVYTGHPFQNFLSSDYDPGDIGKDYPHPLVAVFPGSRYQEIKTMLPVFLPAVKELQKKYPNYSWVLSLSHEDFRGLVEKAVGDHDVEIDILHDRSEAIMSRAYFILACSGTATLKASFFGVPHLIAYRISWLSYFIARTFIYVRHIGMVNIAAGHSVVNEFINHRLKVKAVVEDADRYLGDPDLRESKSWELLEECRKNFCNLEAVDPYALIWKEIHRLFDLKDS